MHDLSRFHIDRMPVDLEGALNEINRGPAYMVPAPTGVAATDTANVKAGIAASDAATPSSPRIELQQGTYALNDELVYNSTIDLWSPAGTVLSWPTDLGTGKYGLRSASPATALNSRIAGFKMQGPAATRTLGVAPCNMKGLLASNHGTIYRDVTIDRFWSGVNQAADHQTFVNVNASNCFYDVYNETNAATGGDNLYLASTFVGATRGSIGYAGAAGTGVIPGSGDQYMRCHFGFNPYIGHRESVASPGSWAPYTKFDLCSFEFMGNGGWFDENYAHANSYAYAWIFRDCVASWGDTRADSHDTGRSITGLFKLGALKFCNLDIEMTLAHDPGYGIFSAALYDIGTAGGQVTEGCHFVNPGFGTGNAAGQRFFTPGSDVRNCTYESPFYGRGRFLYNDGAGTITINKLVKVLGWETCALWSGAVTDSPAGFAQMEAGVTDVIPVTTDGYVSAVTSAAISAGRYLRADNTNLGNVVQAAAFTEWNGSPIVGVSKNAIGGAGTLFPIEARIGGV
jgi:hypothetical protein